MIGQKAAIALTLVSIAATSAVSAAPSSYSYENSSTSTTPPTLASSFPRSHSRKHNVYHRDAVSQSSIHGARNMYHRPSTVPLPPVVSSTENDAQLDEDVPCDEEEGFQQHQLHIPHLTTAHHAPKHFVVPSSASPAKVPTTIPPPVSSEEDVPCEDELQSTPTVGSGAIPASVAAMPPAAATVANDTDLPCEDEDGDVSTGPSTPAIPAGSPALPSEAASVGDSNNTDGFPESGNGDIQEHGDTHEHGDAYVHPEESTFASGTPKFTISAVTGAVVVLAALMQ